MDCGTFEFGKYRGLPACDVPIDYLVWAADTHGQPHRCVLLELRRRAGLHGTRDSVAAIAAISSLTFRQARAARKKPRKERSRAKCKVVRTKPAAAVVGERYAEERAIWLAAGGDTAVPPWQG